MKQKIDNDEDKKFICSDCEYFESIEWSFETGLCTSAATFVSCGQTICETPLLKDGREILDYD